MLCKVCNHEFGLNRSLHYVSRDNREKTGISALAGGEPEPNYYDTFDCPNCGCQIIIGKRLRAVYEAEFIESKEDMAEDEEPQDGQISSPEDGDIDDDLADIKKKIEEAGE